MKTTTLVPAFGSNRLNAAKPAEFLDGCEWIGVPFAGGMSEVAHFTARTLVVNDAHRHVVHLAKIVADPVLGPKLAQRLEALPFHPDTLAQAQEGMVHRERDDFLLAEIDERGLMTEAARLEWAEDYFVCVWMGRSGTALTDGECRGGLALRWNAAGGDSVVRYRSAIEALGEWRKILARATFSVLDFRAFLAKCKDQVGHGIYADPPWPDDGNSYRHKFTEQMQRDLARSLMTYGQTRIVVRFGDHPLIRELYAEGSWTWNMVTGRTQNNNAKAEVLLTRNCPKNRGLTS